MVKTAKKTIGQIYLQSVEFGDGLNTDFFQNVANGNPKDLSITNCQSQKELTINPGTFTDMKELVNLTIKNCAMSSVPAEIRHLSNLTQLHLSTGIINIGAEDFVGLSKLRHLDLSDNNLEYIHPTAFESLLNLEQLKLGPRNRLNGTVFKAVNKVPSLKMLDLRRSQIKVIPTGALNKLKNLQKLYMTTNNLKRLTENMFEGLLNLTYLDLRVNLIEMIEDNAFAFLSNLKQLKLAGNFIAELSNETFAGLEELELLDLGWNEFTQISPYAFSSLSSLVELDLRHNLELSQLDVDSFAGLPNLEKLNMSQTKQSYWKGDFLKAVTNLKILDLSKTELVNLPDDSFQHVPKLQELYLKDNNIKSISSSVFQSVPELKILDISGNLWKCDDELGNFSEFLDAKINGTDSNSFQLLSIADTNCQEPISLQNKNILTYAKKN